MELVGNNSIINTFFTIHATLGNRDNFMAATGWCKSRFGEELLVMDDYKSKFWFWWIDNRGNILFYFHKGVCDETIFEFKLRFL